MKKKHANQAGFTLIEMIVALLIGVMISIAVLRTVFSFVRSQRTLRAISDLTVATETIINELTHDIHWASSMDETGLPDSLFLVVDGQNIDYELNTSMEPVSVTKNGEPLNPRTVKVVDMQIENLSDAGALPLLEITIILENNTTLGSRSIKETKTIVSMRNKQEAPPP